MVEKPVVTVDYREANMARSINCIQEGHTPVVLLYMCTSITWWLFHVAYGEPSKRKDGRLWKENRRLLSKSGEKMFADAHRG